MGHCLGRWVAKIKIDQTNRLEVMNKWFLFLGSSYVSVSRNRAAKTVKTGFLGGTAYPKRTQGYASVGRRIWTVDRHKKNWPSKPPGGDEQMVSIFGIVLCLSSWQSGRQNSENRVGCALDHASGTRKFIGFDCF